MNRYCDNCREETKHGYCPAEWVCRKCGDRESDDGETDGKVGPGRMSDIKFASWTEAQVWSRFVSSALNGFIQYPEVVMVKISEHIAGAPVYGRGATPPDESALKCADKMLLAFRRRSGK